MGLLSLLGAISPVHITCFTLFGRGKKIGEDALGNKYYEAPPRKEYKLTRRWVMYNGAPEATKVPPEWHGWLHHQTDAVPSNDEEGYRRSWQKPYTQNATGTDQAYRPPGHILSGGKRDSATGDYEAWTPEK